MYEYGANLVYGRSLEMHPLACVVSVLLLLGARCPIDGEPPPLAPQVAGADKKVLELHDGRAHRDWHQHRHRGRHGVRLECLARQLYHVSRRPSASALDRRGAVEFVEL